MAAVPPASERRRPRPGSLERPINGRLYRGTWLVGVGVPLLLLAFSVARPAALQAPTGLPTAFDKDAATALAADLTVNAPSRVPGTPGATSAARWFSDQLTQYRITVRKEAFTATVPGHGAVHFVNLLASRPGLSQKTIVVMAHRDDTGAGPGANDNASGTAALLELARAYAPTTRAIRVHQPYSLLFLSTDGAVYGGLGAAWFAAHAPEASNVIAVVNLDAIAGPRAPRLELAGDTPRSPTAGLAETVRAQLATETGRDPRRSSTLRQLIDLGFPYSRYE
ncbi:MAG: hypothetical protein QOE29_1574, partial [Gaiellaceae bacterium]|nr:hypothetical protein [Gaiellaceae bacterium]